MVVEEDVMHVAEAAVPGGDIVVTKLFDAADHSGHLRCKNFAVPQVNAGRRAAFLAASRRGPRPGGSRAKGVGNPRAGPPLPSGRQIGRASWRERGWQYVW